MKGRRSPVRYIIEMCLSIAEELNLSAEQKRDLKYAALLRNIGKLSFSDVLISEPYYSLLPQQQKEYQQHPTLAALAISGIKPLNNTAKILAYVGEQPNGKGFPEGKSEDAIPIAACILKYVSDFFDTIDGHFSENIKNESTFLTWAEENKGEIYQENVVNLGTEIIQNFSINTASDVVSSLVSYYALKEGMTLSEDLKSDNGVLLLTAGTILDSTHIDHLLQLERNSKQQLTVCILT